MARDMTRKELFDDFNMKPGYYNGLAKKHKVALPTLMNRLSPEATPGYPQDAMSEMLARHRLEVSGNATDASSSVEEFLDSGSELGPKETMFWATLERDYDVATSVYDLEQKMKINAGSTTSLLSDEAENSAARPRSTRMLYELNKFRPPVSITDIAGGIETIPGQTWQVPNYATPAADERSTTIPEAGPIPLTTLTTSENTGRTKKIGAGLSISREFELNMTLMSEVRMWVRRQGMRDEIRIVNEGVNVLRTAITRSGSAAATVPLGAGAALGLDAVITVNTHFGSESGYMLDMLLGLKSTVRTWIRANVAQPSGGVEINRMLPGGTFSSVFNNVELVNMTNGPTRVAYFDQMNSDPNIGNTLVDKELIGCDSRWALVLYRQARGVTNENRYDPSTQVRDYFLTQRFGWHLQDEAALARFNWS